MCLHRVWDAAWLLLTGLPPGHDRDTILTRLEEERESSAGVGRAAADPSPPVGGGPTNPITGCPICGEALVCRTAALEWIEE